MANTYITNLDFIPQTFADYVDGQILKKSDFVGSEAVEASDIVFPAYGNTITMPTWDSLSGAAQVKSATAPTINNLTTSAEVSPILDRVQKYGSNDLVASFTGTDPFASVGQKFGTYWAQQMDIALVSATLGAAAGVDALAAGTIINNISGGAGAAAVLSANALIDTQALGGELFKDLRMLVVHSKVMALLRKQNLTVQIPNSDGTRPFEYYGDARVIVSDTLGMDAGSGVYNTLLVAPGAFLYADNTVPSHVLEMNRVIGFADEVASSRRYVMHPRGAKWQGTPAGATATNAELATAGNWTLGAEDALGFKARILRHKIA